MIETTSDTFTQIKLKVSVMTNNGLQILPHLVATVDNPTTLRTSPSGHETINRTAGEAFLQHHTSTFPPDEDRLSQDYL